MLGITPYRNDIISNHITKLILLVRDLILVTSKPLIFLGKHSVSLVGLIEMHLGFLIPLFTGLVAGYFWKHYGDEVAKLLGVACVISLILSLVLAPWQFQVLLLIAVFMGTSKFLN